MNMDIEKTTEREEKSAYGGNFREYVEMSADDDCGCKQHCGRMGGSALTGDAIAGPNRNSR